MQLEAGAFVFAQGDQGDDFYVIEQGYADVIGDGRRIRTLGSGEGFGEIALLRGCRRTTSVRATTGLTLERINQRHFVTAVGGYSSSTNIADDVVTEHLTRFSPEAVGTPEP
jgi:CRP-like cAMP-binding protein